VIKERGSISVMGKLVPLADDTISLLELLCLCFQAASMHLLFLSPNPNIASQFLKPI